MRSVAEAKGRSADDELKAAILDEYWASALTDAEKLMLEYTDKFTHAPASVDKAYVDSLKAQGFDDRMIHDVVQVAAYFNYVNRVVDGLGVEME